MSPPVSSEHLVDGDAVLSRFITESGHFRSDRVLAKAFEPKFDVERRRSETSVFVISDLDDSRVWRLGTETVAATRQKPVLAYARIGARDAAFETLRIAHDAPPEGHAVIVGWPEGDAEKAHRKSIQQELAARAKLVLPNSAN